MSTISKELFEELKQRTVNCVNEPNYESIESLRQFVQKCDNNFINSLYQYSIFPLRLIINDLPKKGNNCEKILESSVECLSIILQKSRINRFDIFSDIFANLFHLIDENRYNINDKEFALKLNEDLILSVIKCAKSLVQSCDDCLLPQVVSPSFSAQFGHSVHILLNTANNQKYSSLKAEAIETVDCLINKCQLSLTQECLKTCPEDMIAYFLPGISINISKLISSDDKLNRRVITSSLTLLSNTIVFVFKTLSFDSEIETKIIDSKPKSLPNDSEVSENEKFIAIRDQKWLENTSNKLMIIFEKIISSLISHQNWNIRQSLLVFVTEILTNCSPLFTNKCLSQLIVVPLTYLSDDFHQIRLESDSFVLKFSKTHVSSDSSKTYMDLIEDQIYSHITRLARIVRTCSESQKITAIYLLFGYLKCLDIKGINYLLYSVQHKQKLLECLTDICCFDYHGIRLLELVTHSDKIESKLSEEQLPHKWIHKTFLYLNDEKAVTALTNCCQLIGQRVESQVLVDYLIDVLRQSKLNPSVVFVANQMISHINTDFTETEELLELYLTNISTSFEDKTVEQMNKDILRQCLLIEGLTSFLHLYDGKTSHNYLMKCVFPLLECVGASHLCVFQSSYRALTLVSQHFGYNSISKLIAENMDYLINSICIHLKHFIDNQMVPIVIKVMLKYSTQDILHLFVDAIEEIIVVIDCYHLTQSLPLMQVLDSFVCTLSYHFVPNVELLVNNQNFDCNQRTNCEKRSQNFSQKFQEFVNNRRITQNLNNENEIISDNEDESDVNEDENKKKVPFFVDIVEKIAERCVHIMSNTDPKVRLIVLEIVIKCLTILKPFEDHLLPMAHKLWSPLVERFADKDIVVIKRSFVCLLFMSKTCGDFIRVRTVKEVIPKILSFVRSQSRISLKKDKASAYRFTIAFHFQIDILLGIGSLAVNLCLADKDLWQLIVDIIPYLHSYQPIPLQEAAMTALKTISELDSNSVFYYLKMTYSSDKSEDNKIFPNLRFGENNKEFAKNVKKLLEYLS